MIARYNTDGITTIHEGVELESDDASGIQAALDAVEASDLVVLCLGNGMKQESEGRDRENTSLTGL